jgi:PTH1 family peptidyl-tRNA hydrolase
VTVLYDEIDLAPGKVRIKRGGGNGGHNGLRSIDPQIGTSYRRVRIGVGHPGHKDAVMPWVLGDFSKEERSWMDPLLETLADNADLLVKGDDNTLMNKLAIAVGGDGAERPQRPETADPTRRKATGQSHIRAARPKSPDAPIPQRGPMADILAKVFGKKDPD